MTIGILIAIIIGIVIIILSVYAIVEWKSRLHNEIDNAIGDSTADDLVLICNNEAQMDQVTNFCCDKKILYTGDIDQEITCQEFAELEVSSDRITNLDCGEIVC